MSFVFYTQPTVCTHSFPPAGTHGSVAHKLFAEASALTADPCLSQAVATAKYCITVHSSRRTRAGLPD